MSIKLKDQNNNEIFIAGTNSEDFINDEVLRNDKTWSSNKIVEELYPTFQKEGNPITCYPVENYPLNVKATFSPKQAGTGDPSPENVRPISGWGEVPVTRCGKNLLDTSDSVRDGFNVNLPNATLVKGTTYTYTVPNTVATDERVGLYVRASDTRLTRYITAGKSETFTVPNDVDLSEGMMLAGVSSTALDNVNPGDFMVELGSTPTAYEPYQGNDYTLTLPETIYGGTADAVTGVGEKTWGYIASYNGESLPGEWISDRDVYTSETTPTTGAQVAYKLATPEPFQATGNQPLPAVAGLNTVYTDGDSLIISGKEDIKYTINQITSNIQNINQIQEINNILLGVE